MKKMLMTAAVLGMLSTPASAAVEFDIEAGTGSANKQDLINLFGNSVVATQDAAESVVFTTSRQRVWQTQCRRIGSDVVRTWRLATTRTTHVQSSVDVNPAGKPQSFTFDGYGGSFVSGKFCPSGWARVSTPVSLRDGVLRLQATFEGETKTLKLLDN